MLPLAPPPPASARSSTNLVEVVRCPLARSPKSATVAYTSRQSSRILMAQRFYASPVTAPIRFNWENPSAKPCLSAAEMRSWRQSTGRELRSHSNPERCGADILVRVLVNKSHQVGEPKIVHTRIQSPGKPSGHNCVHASESVRHTGFERRRRSVCYSPSGAQRGARRSNHSAGPHGEG